MEMKSTYFRPQRFIDDILKISKNAHFERLIIDFFTDLSKMLCIPVQAFREGGNPNCDVLKEEFLFRLDIVKKMLEKK